MMKFKKKLAYIVLGGFLVVIGQLLPGLFATKVTAQGKAMSAAEFDTVTCRSLKIVDDSGGIRAQLEVTKRNESVDDVIQVFNGAGVPTYMVGVSPDGGDVRVYGNNGKASSSIVALSEGGYVSVTGNDGRSGSSMGISSNAGYVQVKSNNGDSFMTVDVYGGVVFVRDKVKRIISTLPPSRKPESPYLTSNAPEDEVEVVDISSKITERKTVWWRFAYRLTLKNRTNQSVTLDAIIEFQDSDGFVIDDTTEHNIVLFPGEERTITGNRLVSMPEAQNVSQYKAKIKLKR